VGWNDNDPLLKYRHALVATLLAVIVSVVIAALIGGALPLEYTGRAWAYAALVCWILAGAFVVFRLTAEGERQPLTAERFVRWVVSLWIWPVFLARRR
jgi:membrane protease YdiL (CAAX protease family)